MQVTELQNARLFQVYDKNITDEMFVLLDEGEPRFLTEIEMKYSYFERTTAREEKKK